MKNLKYAFLLAVLPMGFAFNTHAQVKPIAVLKVDTSSIKRQLKPPPRVSLVQHDFAPAASSATAPISVVKVNTASSTPAFQFKSNVVTYQAGSIHPTPLPATTFQPALITSPGGTVSSINSQGMIIKKN